MHPLGRLHQQMIARKIILVKGFTLLHNNKIMVERLEESSHRTLIFVFMICDLNLELERIETYQFQIKSG